MTLLSDYQMSVEISKQIYWQFVKLSNRYIIHIIDKSSTPVNIYVDSQVAIKALAFCEFISKRFKLEDGSLYIASQDVISSRGTKPQLLAILEAEFILPPIGEL